MKKKILMPIMGLLITSAVNAQNDIESRLANIDWDEDTTEIVTVSDILQSQQKVASVIGNESRINDVWSNRKFTNISYMTTKMTSEEKINTSSGARDLEYKGSWGFAITRGKNFLIHRKPIGNVLSFYIDYVGFDLGVNHYDYEEGSPKYDPNADFTDSKGNSNCLYTPWDFEKFEINYGMRIGPSVTIAPFATMARSGLNFLKFNFYYHFGYNVSANYIKKDKDFTGHYISGVTENSTGVGAAYNLGHGTYSCVGFNISWKKIGFGYETRTGKYEYKPLDSDYGEDKYKFKNTASRVYIQLRW